jgi:endonuclease/exonuclease/phosphatase family metal-dependent hydrolase
VVLSRYPLSDERRYWKTPDAQGRKVTTAHSVLVDVQGRGVRLFNLHSRNADACQQSETLMEIAREARAETPPVIAVGDFNTRNDSGCFAGFVSGFQNACDPSLDASCLDSVNDVVLSDWSGETGPWTYNIDHILVEQGSGLSVVRGWVDTSGDASDHFPVVADLEID